MEKPGTEEDICVTNRAVNHGFSPEPTETAETPHRPTLKYLSGIVSWPILLDRSAEKSLVLNSQT